MEELQIKDIYGVWYNPFWQQTWFVVSGIVISVSLIIILSYWLYKKHHKKPEQSSWEVALGQLKALQNETHKTPKLFYSALTGILKGYLQSRYGILLSGTTDDELIVLLQKSSAVPNEITQIIKELLNGVVLIKFANQEAAQEQMESAIEKAVKLIESTKITDDDE